MDIVVLGGGGNLGRACARALASAPHWGRITVADRDRGAAEEIAAELGPIAEAVAIDIADTSSLVALLRDHDIVVNCVGPYEAASTSVLDAAIEARIHYLDACDDPRLTLDLLDRGPQAEAAGIRAVVGLGVSPGLSNLLAVIAARELDEVVTMHTGWSVDAGEGGFRSSADLMLADTDRPSTVLITWLERLRSDLVLEVAGTMIELRTMVPHRLDYPGIGSGTAWSTAHPEAVTLRYTIGVSGECVNLMVMRRTTAAYLQELRRDLSSGRITAEQAPILVKERPTRRVIKATLNAAATPGPGSLPAFFALAEGRRGDMGLRVGARLTSLPPGLDNTAGITLAIGTELLLDMGSEKTGVFTPEQAIEPDTLLEQLAPWCEPPVRPDALVDVTLEQI